MFENNHPNKHILSAAWALCFFCMVAALFCDALAPDEQLRFESIPTLTTRQH